MQEGKLVAQRPPRLSGAVLAGALAAAGAALYFSALSVPIHRDDFGFIFDDPARTIREAFATTSPFSSYYRPIKVAIYAAIQMVLGTTPWPRHAIALLFHLGVCWMVYAAVRGLGYTWRQAALGAGLMLVAPIGTFVVATSCALCQVMAAFFGVLTLWLAHRSLTAMYGPAGPATRRRWIGLLVAAVLAFAATLCSKEVGLSYLPMLLLVVLAHAIAARRRATTSGAIISPGCHGPTSAEDRAIAGGARSRTEPGTVAPLVGALAFAMPFLACTVLYFWVRTAVGAATRVPGSGTPLGGIAPAGVARNVAALLGAAVQPASIAKLYAAWKHGEAILPVLSAAAALTLIALALAGLWRQKNRRLPLLLGACAVGSLFPAAMMDHVSELYVYNCLPMLTALAGIGLGALLGAGRGPMPKAGVAVFVVAFAAWQVVSVLQNISMVKRQGFASDRMLEGIVALAPCLPPHGTLVLVDPPAPVETYSIYLGQGFGGLLDDKGNHIRRRTGRADANVLRYAWRDFRTADVPAGSLVVFLDPATDRPYIPTESQIQAARTSGAPPR